MYQNVRVGNTTPAEQRVIRLKAKLASLPIWGYYRAILLIGKWRIVDDPSLPTACTNGRDVWLNGTWVDSLPDGELAFVILHEATHICFLHCSIYAGIFRENPMLAGAAADFSINLLIADHAQEFSCSLVKRPARGLYDEKYRGLGTLQIYELLKKQYPPQSCPSCSGNCDQNGSGDTDGKPGGSKCTCPKPLDEHLPADGDPSGNKEVLQASELGDLKRAIDHAVKVGQQHAPVGSSRLGREFDATRKVQENWRAALEAFLVNTRRSDDGYSCYGTPNRRQYALGTVMPTTYNDSLDSIVIAPDMSGSTYGEVFDEVMSHAKRIIETTMPDEVHLIYWDTEVCSHDKFELASVDEILDATRPEGGGGTAPSCITSYLNSKFSEPPEAAVVITDGLVGGDWGKDWPCPVLWVVIDNPSAVATHGVTVHVSMENLY